jgi:hypothetical protein
MSRGLGELQRYVLFTLALSHGYQRSSSIARGRALGMTPEEVARTYWFNYPDLPYATESARESTRRALSSLKRRGLVEGDWGWWTITEAGMNEVGRLRRASDELSGRR